MRRGHIIICRVVYLLLLISAGSSLSAQSLSFSEPQIKLESLIRIVESTTSFSFSYNPNILAADQLIYLPKSEISLDDLMDLIDQHYPYNTHIDRRLSKIIITDDDTYRVSGAVVDSLSGERLPQVIIRGEANNLVATNDQGLFHISVPKNSRQLQLSYIGYQNKTINLANVNPSALLVELYTDNILIDITIKDTPIAKSYLSPKSQEDPSEVRDAYNLGGTGDLFSYLRTKPSVSIGAEGQNGLSVRGGAHDQNMLLIDNIPIYEASHLGGLSSIFLTDAIKSINFYDSSFPAQYDGKLSSVVDVKLKSGNTKKIQKSLSLGIEGIQAHVDGPLSEKLTFNLNGKYSLFGPVVNRLLENNLSLVEPDLLYYDLYGKMSYTPSPSTTISLSSYVGHDNISLRVNPSELNINVQDFNNVEWGNRVHSMGISSALGRRFFLNANLGYSHYNYQSQGSYRIEFPAVGQGTIVEEFAILSKTDIRDYVFSPHLEYYKKNKGKISFGINAIWHQNQAQIIEEDIFYEEVQTIPIVDSLYSTIESGIYIEDQSYLSENLLLTTGIRANLFLNEENNYTSINPRISLSYFTDSLRITLGYDRMNQFIHLLSNPGPGLASDLWVPSTSVVRPQVSSSFSLSMDYRSGYHHGGVAFYYRSLSNLIEYDNPFDIIYSYVVDRDKFNIETDNRSWEERVSTGSGRALGMEVYYKTQVGKMDVDMSYAYSRSFREFDNIDDGASFTYKFDRPHNLHIRSLYRLSKSSHVAVNFAYASGNTFTLANQVQMSPDGGEVVSAKSRNNERTPFFSHLDLDYGFTKSLSNGHQISGRLGIYNILNRYNPYYLYIEEDPNESVPALKQLSLYPRFPRFHIKYQW